MKGSKILDELTRVGRSTRLGTRAAALQNTSDPGLCVLALAAAIPPEEQVVIRVATADLEEAGKATAGDPVEPEVTGNRARVRSNPGDPSSGNLPDRYSEVLEIIRETRLDRLPEGSA